MAKNDTFLLDGIIEDRIASNFPSVKRDEVFEYLALEQILKEYDFSRDEIQHGWIDGGQDGGIDGFYTIVNGHLLQDVETFQWPRSSTEIKVIIISCKHHDTFRQATLDSLIATLGEVFDFSISTEKMEGIYSEELKRMRENLKYAYKKLSPKLDQFSIDMFYASRGDRKKLGEEVSARGFQIEKLAKDCFGSCIPSFSFIGATEIVELYRKKTNYTLELPYVQALAKGERYVVLARLDDYYKFISDDGKLRRYLFESNVRDFMGLNRVNEDI